MGIWGLCALTQVALTVSLFRSANYQQYRYFAAYNLLNLIQSLALLFSYLTWGFAGATSNKIVWSSQSLILVARAMAVVELCRRLLGRYRGIWALGWRLLALCAGVILAYSLLVANWRWNLGIIAAERGLELAIAAAIALLFAFSRFYQVPVSRPDRLLAAGFCLYSCVIVLNDTILENFFYIYARFWNIGIVVIFLISLLIWVRALWSPVFEKTVQPALVEATLYRQLSPEINLRLRLLDEHLLSIWKVEAPNS